MTRPQRYPQPYTGQLVDGVAVAEADDASLAAIAREETARIYGGLVREHHTHACRLPDRDVSWERARLARAARVLTRGDHK